MTRSDKKANENDFMIWREWCVFAVRRSLNGVASEKGLGKRLVPLKRTAAYAYGQGFWGISGRASGDPRFDHGMGPDRSDLNGEIIHRLIRSL
jgi:hypothetical protein